MPALSAALDPTHTPSSCLVTSAFELSFRGGGSWSFCAQSQVRREEEGEGRKEKLKKNGMGSITSPVHP